MPRCRRRRVDLNYYTAAIAVVVVHYRRMETDLRRPCRGTFLVLLRMSVVSSN